MVLKERGGAREARKTRSQSKKFKGFNKSWNVGDKVSVFFPIYWTPDLGEDGQPIMVQEIDQKGQPVFNADGTPKMTESGYWDLVTATVWGHKNNDMKAFNVGGSFIPALTDIERGQPVVYKRDEKGVIVRDEDGRALTEPSPGDVTFQFSLIAPLFVKGAKQREISKIMNRQFPSEDLRRQALTEIDDKYNTEKNMDAPRAVVGRLMMYTSTEVVVCPIDTNNNYLTDKAGQYTYDLTSDEKLNAIIHVLDNIKFKPRDLNQKWIEVEMTFNGDSNDTRGRGQAARKAAPTGLTPEYEMRNRAPESFNKIKSLLDTLPEDSETISYRNFSYRKIEEKKIRRCIENYIVFHSEDLDSITNEEDETYLLQQASRVMQFEAVRYMQNEELKKKIAESYEEYLSKHPELREESQKLVTESANYTEPTFSERPTARDLLGGVDGVSLPGEDGAVSDYDDNAGMTII